MEWRVGAVMGGCGREGRGRVWGHTHKYFVYRHPPHQGNEGGESGGRGWQTFVFMHTLTRLNGKSQWQIGIGRVESGSGEWGPQIGFVPIWEFVAVHAFIMKLNEAGKCLVGHGQNTAPLMFPWQIWHYQEPVLDHKVSNCNTIKNDFWFTVNIQAVFGLYMQFFLQDVSDKSALQK